jgi:hypothetical protein
MTDLIFHFEKYFGNELDMTIADISLVFTDNSIIVARSEVGKALKKVNRVILLMTI